MAAHIEQVRSVQRGRRPGLKESVVRHVSV